MKAVILAAGQGTRLRPVTLTMPKPLVPVANKSLIAYAIDTLKGAGLTDIGIVVNSFRSPICERLGDGRQFGVRVQIYRPAATIRPRAGHLAVRRIRRRRNLSPSSSATTSFRTQCVDC